MPRAGKPTSGGYIRRPQSGIVGTKMKNFEQKLAKNTKATAAEFAAAAGLLLMQNPGIFAVGATISLLRGLRELLFKNSLLLSVVLPSSFPEKCIQDDTLSTNGAYKRIHAFPHMTYHCPRNRGRIAAQPLPGSGGTIVAIF